MVWEFGGKAVRQTSGTAGSPKVVLKEFFFTVMEISFRSEN